MVVLVLVAVIGDKVLVPPLLVAGGGDGRRQEIRPIGLEQHALERAVDQPLLLHDWNVPSQCREVLVAVRLAAEQHVGGRLERGAEAKAEDLDERHQVGARLSGEARQRELDGRRATLQRSERRRVWQRREGNELAGLQQALRTSTPVSYGEWRHRSEWCSRT